MATKKNPSESTGSSSLKSGLIIQVSKRRKKDLLELTDLQFITVLFNALKTFRFEGQGISQVLIERVVRTYIEAIHHNPQRMPTVRIAAIVALEEMGKRFIKDEQQWKECLSTLGFVQNDMNDRQSE
jgi:hypothetical protein